MVYPPAYMGFVGFVKVDGFGIRCTSCELKLTQTIEKPDVVAAKYDKTVYKLGPKEVGGTIAFPAVMESIGSTELIPRLWEYAFFRNNGGAPGFAPGGTLNPFEAEVKYTSDNANFLFSGNKINSWKFSVAQSDLINVEIDVIGTTRGVGSVTEPYFANRNARALTWNDARIIVRNKPTWSDGDAPEVIIKGEWMRNFEITVNNNVERFYTMNGLLAPQDVAAKQREITGSMTIMGRQPTIAELALTNVDRCHENSSVQFGYDVSGICGVSFGVELPGTVFEIEQMGLKNDLMESTVAFHVLPGSVFSLGAAGDPDRALFRNDVWSNDY